MVSTAGISFCDSLQSCPYDNSAPDRYFRFSKEKEEAGFWMVFSVFHGFNAGLSFCDALQRCPYDNSAPFIGILDFQKRKKKWAIIWFFGFLMVLTHEFRFAMHYKVVRITIPHLIGISHLQKQKKK
jgi:hypothetical protein